MAKDRDQFIEELVSGHRPMRVLPAPGSRALRWFLIAVLANVALMVLVQPFRPGFAGQLAAYPRLLIEVATGLLCVAAFGYLVFAGVVPGERVARATKVVIAALGGVFVLSVVVALAVPSPESSPAGMRPACLLEVYVLGSGTLLVLFFWARRGYLRFSPGGSVVFGVAAGLIPATLMQIACMYDPWHALDHHYAPVLALALIGALVVKLHDLSSLSSPDRSGR